MASGKTTVNRLLRPSSRIVQARPDPEHHERDVRAAGASLLELLMAVGLFMVLTGALLSWVWMFQQAGGRLNRALERDENLHLAPLLLTRLVSSAGNQQWKHGWTGLSLDDSLVEVRADLEGEDGFPDGTLAGRFEDLRLDRRDSQLSLRSGGGSFQPILTKITGWTATRPADTVLRLTVQGRAAPTPGSSRQDEEILEVEVFLPNYRANLFPEEVP